MQNNSKTNTILLIIIAILLAVIAYALFEKKSQISKNSDRAIAQEDKTVDNNASKSVIKKEEIPGLIFLKELLSEHPTIAGIVECSYNGKIYFRVDRDTTPDSWHDFFDTNAALLWRAGGPNHQISTPYMGSDYVLTEDQKLYQNISSNCKKTIFRPSENIDLYHLKS